MRDVTNRTAILLGAGASKALFGLPVMAEFYKSYDSSKYPNLTRFLARYFFTAGGSGESPQFDLEELFKLLLLEERIDSVYANKL